MDALRGWLAERWQDTLIPLAVFLASLSVLLWLRRLLGRRLDQWVRQTRWQGDEILLQALRRPALFWVVLISAYLGLQASQLSSDWKVPVGRGLWTAFTLSLAFILIRALGGLLSLYGERLKVPGPAVRLISHITTILVVVLAVLVLLDLWGGPVGPLLLAIGIAALAAGIALRDVLPSFFAFFQLNATGRIKPGDYIRLETGEEGYVLEIGWRDTQLEALDESRAFVPNSKLLRTTVINYGRPLKKAKEPFRFYSRSHLKELTGLRAENLQELLAILKTVPDSVIYYHTHHFLEEHHYLTPEPASDFALWVSDAIGDAVLGERLAAIDTFEFPTLGALRERLVHIIEEHLTLEPDHENGHRNAPEGREFHFIKSVSVILPTPYVAHDLREFVEALRKVSLGSLYFHVFESRLRLGRGLNDFSVWMRDSLDERDIAEQIARLDPYNYTLEGLRLSLIQLIEKRIK